MWEGVEVGVGRGGIEGKEGVAERKLVSLVPGNQGSLVNPN